MQVVRAQPGVVASAAKRTLAGRPIADCEKRAVTVRSLERARRRRRDALERAAALGA